MALKTYSGLEGSRPKREHNQKFRADSLSIKKLSFLHVHFCWLLSSSSSSEWPDAKLASSDLRELAGFSVAADDPCTSPPPGRICCSTDWGKVQGIMALSLLVTKLLEEGSPSLLFRALLPLTFSSSCQKIKGLGIEWVEGCKVNAILRHACQQVLGTVLATIVP